MSHLGLLCTNLFSAPLKAGGKSKVTGDLGSKEPNCQCGAPSKVVQVKMQGPNNGRFFYACNGARNQQCKVGEKFCLLIDMNMMMASNKEFVQILD